MSVEHIEVNGRELTAFDLPSEPRNTYHVDVDGENAKLRELVRDMWHLLFNWLFRHQEVPWKEIESVFDRIGELGIEVDE